MVDTKLCQLVHPVVFSAEENTLWSALCVMSCFLTLYWRNALLRVTRTNCVLRAKIKPFLAFFPTYTSQSCLTAASEDIFMV